jgi:hypothetical protein
LTVRNYLDAIEALEDTVSAIGKKPEKFIHTSRICIQYGLLSLLNHSGHTSQRTKFIFDWCENVKDQQTRALLDNGSKLFFTGPFEGTDNHTAFVNEIADFLKAVRSILQTNPEVKKAIAYLRETISYVDVASA